MNGSPSRPIRSGLWCSLGIAVLLLTGCGETLYPVEGKVMVNDKPLTTGTVIFHPDESKGNSAKVLPGGEIDAQGNYKIFTKGKPGAPAGWYKVTVTAAETPDSAKPNEAKKYVADKFGTPSKTPLAKEVVPEAAPGAYDLKVTAP
jgi:hypothetical protein